MHRISKIKGEYESRDEERKDRLVRAIAIEQTIKDSLIKQNKELASVVASVVKEREDTLKDIDSLKNKKRKHSDDEAVAKDRAMRAQADADEKERKVKEMEGKLSDLNISVEFLRNTQNAEQAIVANVRARDSGEYANHITLLGSQIQSMEERVRILSKTENDISKSIEDKKLEQAGIDRTLEFRLQELARISTSIDSTNSEYEKARQEYKLFETRLQEAKKEFTAVDTEVKNKTKELKTKEDEVEKKREQLLALVMREKKLDERSGFIKDLFDKAGIEIKM